MKTTILKNIFKKFSYAFLSFTILFSSCVLATNTNSLTDTANFELVEDHVCHVVIGEGTGEFERKLTEFNAKDKSLTFELTMKNLKEIEEKHLPVEVFLVIDNSTSMTDNLVDGETRKKVVIDSANVLSSKLFSANENTKVGVISFSSLDSANGETEGTINDAQLQVGLSDNEIEVASAISAIENTKTGPRTNIEAGITLAYQHFSTEENTLRYIILLSDGVPNNAIDGTFSTYTGNVASRTKAKLQEIENNGISIFGCMIGLDSETVEPTSHKTYKALAEEVFGTVDNPTLKGYYFIPDDKNVIEQTIVETIYEHIVVVKDNALKNIVIKDYFPQEIIDNFDFSYVTQPTLGTISNKIDSQNRSITWTIPSLAEGKVAKVSYKLTLKDGFSEEILDDVLSTNEKVEIEAEDAEHGTDNPYQESSDVTPKIKVTKPIVRPEPKPDVAPDPIPQTGENNMILCIIAIVGIMGIMAIVKDRKLK